MSRGHCTRCAEVEQQLILDGERQPVDRSAVTGQSLQSLRQRVDALHGALERKQRSTQALRLQVNFTALHELRLEEKQGLSRCVSLRRQLAVVDPQTVPTARPKEVRPRNLAEAAEPDGWSDLAALIADIAAELTNLQACAAEALNERVAQEREAESIDAQTASRDAEARTELEGHVEQAKAKVRQLRERRAAQGGSAGGSIAEDAAADTVLRDLQASASRLLEEKSALEEDVDELARTLRALERIEPG